MDSDPRNGRQILQPKLWRGWRIWIFLGLVLAALALSGYNLLLGSFSSPKTAPEADQALAAQSGLPFQVLIPAYLPVGFNRSTVQIDTGMTGPAGEPAIRLTYPGRGENALVLREWMPANADFSASAQSTGIPQPRVVHCGCHNRMGSQCDLTNMEIAVGAVHILVESTSPGLITAQQMQFILNTLGPAANRQIYTSMQDVPVVPRLPPAVDVPINAQGIQELTLVVAPQGYSPAHFAVKRGVPVRIVFRQVGEVGCGNELIFSWGNGKSADLVLASVDDARALEFTPDRAGDFPFHCPHYIYQGAMTVRE